MFLYLDLHQKIMGESVFWAETHPPSEFMEIWSVVFKCHADKPTTNITSLSEGNTLLLMLFVCCVVKMIIFHNLRMAGRVTL